MKIAFHVNTFTIRGTEIAIFDYAYYNQTILGNESIIMIHRDYDAQRDVQGNLENSEEIEKKFHSNFTVLTYTSMEHLEKLLVWVGCDLFYVLKYGQISSFQVRSVPSAVHCVFCCSNAHRHGTVYAAIANTIIPSGESFPVVPHICLPLPEPKFSFREKLGIPSDAVVFGRYGGPESFNIPFVQQTVLKVAKEHPNIFFVFMNTTFFGNAPNIFYLAPDTDPASKAVFVGSCDAMLHARLIGESFGLAIAEFTSLGKPIITYRHAGPPHEHEHLNHIDVLGDTGIYYENAGELESILTNFEAHRKTPANYSEIFTPQAVMAKFKEVFIDPIQ